jgi:hypothetical protein
MKVFCGGILLLFLCLMPGLLDYFDIPSTYCGVNSSAAAREDGMGIGTSIFAVVIYFFVLALRLLGIQP